MSVPAETSENGAERPLGPSLVHLQAAEDLIEAVRAGDVLGVHRALIRHLRATISGYASQSVEVEGYPSPSVIDAYRRSRPGETHRTPPGW